MQPQEWKSSFSAIMLTWYIYRFCYPIALFLIKLSILLFYLRLTQATHSTFRRAVYGTIILLCAYTLTIVSISIFMCGKPSNGYSLEYAFQAVREPSRNICLNVNTVWFAQSGLNLLTDVIILILPMPMLLELHIPLYKKVALVAAFSVGSGAVVAACLRVWLISEWSKDLTAQARYAYIMLIGGQIELNAGIVSACIPFLKPLLERIKRSGNEKV